MMSSGVSSAGPSAAGRGALIVLEGCDRSGKSTQSKLLVDSLVASGFRAKLMRFPARETAIGQSIDGYLRNSLELSDQAIHLLFSANRWELKNSMEDDLKNGTTLVLDRYAYSGVAFTAAKGIDQEWCKAPDAGLPAPDLTIFLDIPVDAAATRGDYGEERYENKTFQQKVAHQFTLLRTPSWKVINANQDIPMIAKQLLDLAQAAIHENRAEPLKRLW